VQTRIKSIAVILATALVLAATLGCDEMEVLFEGAPYPIGTENQAVFDAGLIGVWHSVPMGDESMQLTVRSRDGRTYEVEMSESDDNPGYVMSGFVVDVDGIRYLNGRLEKVTGFRVSGYMLLRYQLEVPDGLVLASVDSDGWAERGVASADGLLRYLQAHRADDTLYSEATHFRRVSLWGRAQPNNRLKLAARGRSTAAWRLRPRAAAYPGR